MSFDLDNFFWFDAGTLAGKGSATLVRLRSWSSAAISRRRSAK